MIKNNGSIDQVAFMVKSRLVNAEAGHDWLHVERVWSNALKIMEDDTEANEEIVVLAVLLHDIADSKFFDGDESMGLNLASQIMASHNVNEMIQKEVLLIIDNMSYKGGFKKSAYDSLELKIVQDADRLDAIGAIGIARAFTFGGYKNRRFYDKEILPEEFESREAYKKNEGPTINHFYEKLLKLKGLMHTAKGKEMAQERHEFMLLFLESFKEETGWMPEV